MGIVMQLMKYGLGLIASAVKAAGKQKVEEVLGVKIPDKLDDKTAKILKAKEIEKEPELLAIIEKMQENEVRDRIDAREREIEVLRTPDIPVVNKVFQPFLATVIVLVSFFLAIFAIKANIPQGKENLLYFILGSVFGGGFTVVVNYYFGSSDDSSRHATNLINSFTTRRNDK